MSKNRTLVVKNCGMLRTGCENTNKPTVNVRYDAQESIDGMGANLGKVVEQIATMAAQNSEAVAQNSEAMRASLEGMEKATQEMAAIAANMNKDKRIIYDGDTPTGIEVVR